MAVHSDQRVRVGQLTRAVLHRPHHARQVLQVDLVLDARARRIDAKPVESHAGPAQELIALTVFAHLHVHVVRQCTLRAPLVGIHGMVDDEVHRQHRVDGARIATQFDHGVAHCGHVTQQRDAGRLGHHDSRWQEADLAGAAWIAEPAAQAFDFAVLGLADRMTAQHVLHNHLQAQGQARDAGQAGGLRRLQADVVVGAPTRIQRAPQ